jgi:hypothetical protein
MYLMFIAAPTRIVVVAVSSRFSATSKLAVISYSPVSVPVVNVVVTAPAASVIPPIGASVACPGPVGVIVNVIGRPSTSSVPAQPWSVALTVTVSPLPAVRTRCVAWRSRAVAHRSTRTSSPKPRLMSTGAVWTVSPSISAVALTV